MSECARFVDRLLEADPAELHGSRDSELAEHVRGCARCARLAEAILADTARLDAALGRAPTIDVDGLIERAVRATDASARRPARRRLPKPTPFGPKAWWVGLAAAAALAALILVRRPGTHTTVETRPLASATAARTPAPIVEPEDGQDIAIIQTDNPNITVAWLF